VTFVFTHRIAQVAHHRVWDPSKGSKLLSEWEVGPDAS